MPKGDTVLDEAAAACTWAWRRNGFMGSEGCRGFGGRAWRWRGAGLWPWGREAPRRLEGIGEGAAGIGGRGDTDGAGAGAGGGGATGRFGLALWKWETARKSDATAIMYGG